MDGSDRVRLSVIFIFRKNPVSQVADPPCWCALCRIPEFWGDGQAIENKNAPSYTSCRQYVLDKCTKCSLKFSRFFEVVLCPNSPSACAGILAELKLKPTRGVAVRNLEAENEEN
jgi:hypothetical protein